MVLPLGTKGRPSNEKLSEICLYLLIRTVRLVYIFVFIYKKGKHSPCYMNYSTSRITWSRFCYKLINWWQDPVQKLSDPNLHCLLGRRNLWPATQGLRVSSGQLPIKCRFNLNQLLDTCLKFIKPYGRRGRGAEKEMSVSVPQQHCGVKFVVLI